MRELIIDLDAIAYNLDVMRKKAGGVKVCGVVKANACLAALWASRPQPRPACPAAARIYFPS